MTKLNLACGEDYKNGYINVDFYDTRKADEVWDIRNIPYPDNSVDEILASHIIEHFDAKSGPIILKEWLRVLKPGGILKLETPDLLSTCKDFVAADEQRRILLYPNFFSMAEITPGQAHLFLYTEFQLFGCLRAVGYSTIKRVTPWSNYATNQSEHHLFLAVEATK